MTKLFASAAAVLLATAAPALADSPAPASASQAAESGENIGEQNKVVCRRVEAIGTRLSSKRVCRTKSEWTAQLAADRQALERIQALRLPRE